MQGQVNFLENVFITKLWVAIKSLTWNSVKKQLPNLGTNVEKIGEHKRIISSFLFLVSQCSVSYPKQSLISKVFCSKMLRMFCRTVILSKHPFCLFLFLLFSFEGRFCSFSAGSFPYNGSRNGPVFWIRCTRSVSVLERSS